MDIISEQTVKRSGEFIEQAMRQIDENVESGKDVSDDFSIEPLAHLEAAGRLLDMIKGVSDTIDDEGLTETIQVIVFAQKMARSLLFDEEQVDA